MKVTSLKIPAVKLIEPDVFVDKRGFFFESFNQEKFNKAVGRDISFVQDNHSKSSKYVLRGMHYQEVPFDQGKLVRAVFGKIYDVALDIREDSPTYGQWVSQELSAENKKQLWIPEGFAHGFLVLTDYAEVVYKTNQFYSKTHEKVICYNDPRFGIDWPIADNKKIILSQKDFFKK